MARTMTDEQENESRAALTLAARVAELEARCERLAGGAIFSQARINGLRNALEEIRTHGPSCYMGSDPSRSCVAIAERALASTPAADLAAHDAEVRKSVLMEAATWFEGSGEPIGKATAQFIRALAAQEVKK